MVFVPHPFNVNITIKSEGETLAEHIDDTTRDGGYRISRYVECKANKQFEIRVDGDSQTNFRGNAIGISAHIDGERMWAQAIPRGFSAGHHTVLDHTRPTPTSQRAFRFAELVIDPNGHFDAQDKGRLDDLGTIELRVVHLFVHGYYPQGITFGNATRNDHQNLSVAETALKGRAISHRAILDTPLPCQEIRCLKATPIDAPAIVKFYYRSRADIEAMHIIEQPASPSPPEAGDTQTTSQEEIRRVEEEIRQMETKLNRLRSIDVNPIKREREEADPPSSTNKRARNTASVVIEIDDDGATREIPLPASLASLRAEVEID